MDWPAEGEIISQLISTSAGFIAVGHVQRPSADCFERFEGRVWTSADGQSWTRSDEKVFADVRLWGIVEMTGRLYSFGYLGAADCNPPAGYGHNVWRSDDGGRSWLRLTEGAAHPFAHWNDVALAGDSLVVVGRPDAGDDDDQVSGIWLSANGADWQPSPGAPQSGNLTGVAARGRVVVAFGEDPAAGLAWYSKDYGQNWAAGRVRSGYLPQSVELVATDRGFWALSSACCGLPMELVGMAFFSTDGMTWAADTGTAWRAVPERGAALSIGLLSLSSIGEGQLWTGGRWVRAPAPPPSSGVVSVAALENGVVVAITVRPRRGHQAWRLETSSLGALMSAPAPAKQPEIGRAYDYILFSHCDLTDARVLFGGETWLVKKIVEGRQPFGDPTDKGEITRLSTELARYVSDGGRLELYRASDPQSWPRCL